MALPKLATATYELQLPSKAETVKYRPFLVKEQKVLMMAQQSKVDRDRNNAILEIIESCTFGKVGAKNPIFDIEYVFLKLRSKSAGESVDVMVTCPDDGQTKEKVTINIDEIDVNMTENHTNKINITDTITINMRYPLVSDIDLKNASIKDDVNGSFNVVKKCIDSIEDGDKVLTKADYDDKELDEFLNSFNTDQLNKVMEFFQSMPKLRHPIRVKNSKTGVESDVILEGLESFL